MPLDRLPPAPAPTVPTPKRQSRASGEDAQSFALPESEPRKSASASNAETAKRDAAKNREAKDARERDSAAESQAQTETRERQNTGETATTLNDIFAQALQGEGETVSEAQSDAATDVDANASKDATAKAGSDSKPAAGASDTDSAQASNKAQPGAQANAAPAAPSASDAAQDDAASEEVAVVKPASAGKADTDPSSKPSPSGATDRPHENATPSQANSGQAGAAQDADAAVDHEDGRARVKQDAAQNTQTAQDRPARSSEPAQQEASPQTGSDKSGSVAGDQAKAQPESAKPQPSAASTEAADNPSDDSAAFQARAQNAAQTQSQGQTQSASAVADEAEAAASAQAAFKDGVEQTRRADSDRAPGVQNKTRHADKSEAGSKSPAPSGAAEAGANKSGGTDTASAARPAQIPTAAAAASAPTDPLAWLLQESLMTGEAPVEAPVDTAEPELDMSTVRAEPRVEAARPSQHPQAHAASRFAPTTTQTLAAQIARKFNDGGRVFDIRLDPPELGRVEVRLELGPDNKVSAVLSAERADTLSELQRSARDLEKALTDAGLELGEDGLSFSLSEDNGAFSSFQDEAGGSADGFSARNQFTLEVETDLPGAPLTDALYGFAVSQRAGVNLIA